MKKLLLLLTVLISFLSADAQLINGVFYNKLNNFYGYRGIYADSNFAFPGVIATKGIMQNSAYVNSTDSSLYIKIGTTWVKQRISGSGGSGAVSSVFGRTGVVTAQSGDYSAFYPQLSGSYANPTWITSLPFSKITSATLGADLSLNPNGYKYGVTNSDMTDISGTPFSFQINHGSGNFGLGLIRNDNGASGFNLSFYRTQGSGTSSTKAAVYNGGSLGTIQYFGVPADNTSQYNAASIAAYGFTDVPSYMTSFATAGTLPTSKLATWFQFMVTDFVGTKRRVFDIFPSGQIIMSNSSFINWATAYKLQVDGNSSFHGAAVVGSAVGVPISSASAQFEVLALNKGVLFPRMSTTERSAISSPAHSLFLFDRTVNRFVMYDSVSSTYKKILLEGDAAGAGTTPTLQQVTEAGYTTDQPVLFEANASFMSGLYKSTVSANTLGSNRSIYLPNASGTIPVSIRFNGTSHSASVDGVADIGNETDPLYSASTWPGTTNNSAQWNYAYTQSTKGEYWNNGTGGGTLLRVVDDSTTKIRAINVPTTSEINVDTTASTTDKFNVSLSLVNSSVALSKMATIGANTLMGNNIGSSANPSALSVASVKTMLGNASSSTTGFISNTDYNKVFTYQSSANPTGTITHDGNNGSRHSITFTSTGGRTLAFSNISAGYLVTFYVDNTSGSTIALTLPSNGYVQNTSGIYASASSVTVPTGKSTISLVLYDGTNYWYTTSF